MLFDRSWYNTGRDVGSARAIVQTHPPARHCALKLSADSHPEAGTIHTVTDSVAETHMKNSLLEILVT